MPLANIELTQTLSLEKRTGRSIFYGFGYYYNYATILLTVLIRLTS